jgi:hypothetical protein
MDNAEVVVFKLAAAQRQLDAAIRMYFSGEDELAIYTVAAAAHRILRDLMEKRGRSAAAEILRDALRDTVEQIEKDLLKENLRLPAGVRDAAIKLTDNRVFTEFKTHGSAFDRKFWQYLNESANFLKHADRDADAAIDAGKIAVEPVLDGAVATYTHLMTEPTVEMLIYGISRHIEVRNTRLPDESERLRLKLARVPARRRGKASIQLIAELKRWHRIASTPR